MWGGVLGSSTSVFRYPWSQCGGTLMVAPVTSVTARAFVCRVLSQVGYRELNSSGVVRSMVAG